MKSHMKIIALTFGLVCIAILSNLAAAEKKPAKQWSNDAYYLMVGVEAQKQWEEKYDKKNIRFSTEMYRHESKAFLEIPDYYGGDDAPINFEIAKTPPIVDFGIVQGLEPRYFDKPKTKREKPVWGGWGEVELGPDGAFYFAEGNHRAYGADAMIVRYDPARRKQSIALSSRKVVGWKDSDYGDGKLHGEPIIDPNGDMWLLTFNSPEPTPEEVAAGYRGSYLIHYNVKIRKAENLGIPLEDQTWPYHVWDWRRGLLVGSNIAGDVFLAYDTKKRLMVYGGHLPDGIGDLYSHSLFVDPDTGNVYGSIVPPKWNYTQYNSLDPHYLFKYERRGNKFTKLQATVPPIAPSGGTGAIAGATPQKDAKGRFWCFSSRGTMFTFDPVKETTESVGANWLGGCYTYDLCISPGKRYLYYVPGSDTQAWIYGLPVIQYDISTGKRKVIAFIELFFRAEYGYSAGGTYGLALDAKGESLFFYVNGAFVEPEHGRSGYGRPAMFHVHIPESERIE
jgi:hypothetical protein